MRIKWKDLGHSRVGHLFSPVEGRLRPYRVREDSTVEEDEGYGRAKEIQAQYM